MQVSAVPARREALGQLIPETPIPPDPVPASWTATLESPTLPVLVTRYDMVNGWPLWVKVGGVVDSSIDSEAVAGTLVSVRVKDHVPLSP